MTPQVLLFLLKGPCALKMYRYIQMALDCSRYLSSRIVELFSTFKPTFVRIFTIILRGIIFSAFYWCKKRVVIKCFEILRDVRNLQTFQDKYIDK